MFKNLKKKIEQGVAQSPLLGAIKTATDAKPETEGTPSKQANNEQVPGSGASPFNARDSSPAKMEPSSQTMVDGSPQSPQLGQLVDVPLFNAPSDEAMSPTNGTPQPTRSRQSSISSVTSESPFFPPLNLSHVSYDLPSEAESEMDESIHSNLDGYTKEDLYNVIKRLERRSHKYKGRFKDVVSAYKELQQDKEKIKNSLTLSQDKAFRRISELKEQANLDKLAKKDLEENYRLMLEEKDEFVSVLQTQVRLLKEGKQVPAEIEAKASGKTNVGDGDTGSGDSQSVGALTEKVKRQEALLNRCKESIKNHKDKIAQLSSEKVLLQKQLEEKGTELNSPQEGSPSSPSHDEENAKLKRQIKEARRVIEDLEADKQLAIAEAKQQMHEEIETKDQELGNLRTTLQTLTEENKQLTEKVDKLEQTGHDHLQKSREIIKRLKDEKNQAVAEMEEKVKVAEERIEQEKESLVQELSRGKTAAVTLLQQESEKKMEEIASEKEMAINRKVVEWQEKLDQLEKTHQEKLSELEKLHQEDLAMKDKEREHALGVREEEIQKRLSEKEEEMRLSLEERDLQKMAALSQQDSAKDGLLEQIDSLNTAKLELENMLIKYKEDRETEAANWASEKATHAEEVDKLKLKFQNVLDNLKSKHKVNLQEQALKLKEVHSEQMEELSRKHQDMVQGSSSEVEEYYKAQLETLKAGHDQVIQVKALQIEAVNQTLKEAKAKLEKSEAEFTEKLQEEAKARDTLTEKYESELSELKTNVQTLLECKAELEQKLEAKDIEMNALQATFKGNLENVDAEWKQKLDELESEHKKRIGEMAQSDNSRVTEAESKVTQMHQQLEEEVRKQQVISQEKQTVENEKQTLETALEALKKQVEDESHTAEEVRESLKQKTEEVDALKKTSEEREAALNLLDARCQDLEAEVAQKSKAFDDKVAEIEQMQEKFGKLKTEAKSRIQGLKERTDEMAEDLSKKTEEVIRISAEVSSLQQKLEESQGAQKNMEESFKEKFSEKQKQYKEHLHKMKEAFQAKLNEKEKAFHEKLEELTKERAESEEGVVSNLETLRQQQIEELSSCHKRKLEETVSEWESRVAEAKDASASEIASLKQDNEEKLKDLQSKYDTQVADLSAAHETDIEKLHNQLQDVTKKLNDTEAALELTTAQRDQELSLVSEELKAVQASASEKEGLISDQQTSSQRQAEIISNLEQQVSDLKLNLESVTEKHTCEIQEKVQASEEKIRLLESSKAVLEENLNSLTDSSRDQESQLMAVKEEKQTVIDSLQQSLQEKSDFVTELQQKLQDNEQLVSEKDTIVARLNEDIAEQKIQLEAREASYQSVLSEKENALAEIAEHLDVAKSEIHRLKEHHEESLKRVETEMGTHVKEQQNEMEERLRKAMAEEARLKGELEIEISSLKSQHEEQMQNRDAELVRLQQQVNILDQSQEKIKTLMSESRGAFDIQVAENARNLQQLQETKDAEISKLLSEIDSKDALIQDVRGEHEKLKNELSEVNVKLQEQQQQLVEKDSELNQAKVSLETLVNNQDGQLVDLQRQFDQQKASYEVKVKDLESSHEAVVEAVKEEYNARISDLTANDQELQEQLRQLREKLNAAEERLHECIQTYDSQISEYKVKLDKQQQSFYEEKSLLQQQLCDMDTQAKLNSEGLQNSLQSKVREAEQQLLESRQDHSKQLEDLEKKSEENLVELKQKYNAKLKEIKGKLMGRINELENVKASELQESSEKIQDLERLLKNEKSERETLYNELSQSNTKLLQLQESGQSSESHLLEVTTALQERETQLAKLQKIASDRENLVSDLIKSQETAEQKTKDSIESKEKEIASLKVVISEKDKRIEELDSQLHNISDDISLRLETSEKRHAQKMQEQLKSYADSVEIAQNQTKELEGELNNVRTQHTENQSKVVELEDLVRQWKDRCEMLQTTLDGSNVKIDELTDEIERTNQECAEKLSALQSQHANELQELTDRTESDGNTKVTEYKKKAETYLVQMRKQFQEEKDTTLSQHKEVTLELEGKLETLRSELESAKLEKQNLVDAHERERQKLELSFSQQLKEKEQLVSETLKQSETSRESEAQLQNTLQVLKEEKDQLNSKIVELENEKSEQGKRLEQKVKSLEKEINKTLKQFEKYKTEKELEIEELNKTGDENLKKLHSEYEEERREMEGTHSSQVKQLIKELNLKLAEKEKAFQDTFQEALGKSNRDEDRLMLEHKQAMDEMYNDLHEKDKHMEELVEQHAFRLEEKEKEAKASFAELEAEVASLKSEIANLSESHQKALLEAKQGLEEGFKKRLAEKEVAHREEIDALAKEWNTERQADTVLSQNASSVHSSEELVVQNQFALAAIQSGSTSGDLLRQQIMEQNAKMEELKSKHKLELAELQSQIEMSQNRAPLVAAPGTRNLYQEFEPKAAEEIQNLELHNMDMQAQVSHLMEEIARLQEKEKHMQEKIEESAHHHSTSFHSPGGTSFHTPGGASFHTPPSSPYPLSGNSTPSGPLLTEPTEMEYLRNILFQYMIGKETKTLAKVIATVMKFTDDQTAKILLREDSKTGVWSSP